MHLLQGSHSLCWGGVPSAPAADANCPDVGVAGAGGPGGTPVQGPLQLAGPAAAVGGHQVGGGLTLDDAGQRGRVVGAAFAVPRAAVHPVWQCSPMSAPVQQRLHVVQQVRCQ